MEVREIDLKQAGPFIKKWHYSGVVPTGKNLYYGWFDGDTLYAVANYGIGVNPYQTSFLEKETGFKVEAGNLLELKRLCRTEPRKEDSPLTKFLSKAHKLLKKKGYQYIVSFSDPAYGHNGGIYKAANFKWLGQTKEEWHVVDKDGNARHRRVAYRYAKANGLTIDEARKLLELTPIKTPGKDRWFIKI